MAFDISTATPVGQSSGFDLTTAKPVIDKQALHDQIAAQIANDPITQGAKNFAKDMSFGDQMMAGSGKMFSDLAQGVKQKLGLASDQDVAEKRAIDAPLMETAGGKTGAISTAALTLAPTAMIPGAATIPGAAVIGGLYGSLQPSTSIGEQASNTAMSALGGAGGQWVANKIGAAVEGKALEGQLKAAQNSQKVAAATQANKAGYVIPPEDLTGGMANQLLSGLSGKAKTAQVASARNQDVTNALAKSALGLPDNAPITQDALSALRANASQAYQAIKGSGTVTADGAYAKALDNIAQKYTTAAQAFPGAAKSEVPDLVEALKQPTFSADGAVEMTKILRSKADAAFAQGDKGTSKAFKEASDALESMLERHLQSLGNADALKAFQQARQTIAKTYTVGKALNASTGDVSAPALAAQLAKGKPLSGDLLTIAQAAQAFPKATQALKETPKSLSPLDWAFAGGGAMTGHPGGLAMLGARPAARAILLSAPVQRAALNAMSQPEQASALMRLLAAEPYAALPIGVATGAALSP